MVNVKEIEQKLLQQFKNNHQKSISEDNLCRKLIDKYEEIEAHEIDEIKAQVKQYKEVRDLVLYGELYRLNNPLEENLFCEIVVSKDREDAFITVMRPISIPNSKAVRIYPRGLDKTKNYFIPELELTKRGDTLMNAGVLVHLGSGDFKTKTYRLTAVK